MPMTLVNFRDTFIPRLGLEWLWESGIRMRRFRYQASPAPLLMLEIS